MYHVPLPFGNLFIDSICVSEPCRRETKERGRDAELEKTPTGPKGALRQQVYEKATWFYRPIFDHMDTRSNGLWSGLVNVAYSFRKKLFVHY